MKKFLLACLLAIAPVAYAEPRIEFGLGYAQGHKMPDNTWYQKGFPYSMDLRSASWSLGVTDDITPTLRYHVKYVAFGVAKTDALATPVDDNFLAGATPPCKGECVAVSRFVGSGRSDGIAAMLEKHTTGEIEYGVSGGLFVFQPTWDVTVYNWKQRAEDPGITIQHSIKKNIVVRPVVGFNVRKGDWDFRVEHYFNKAFSSAETGVVKSTTNVSVVYRF